MLLPYFLCDITGDNIPELWLQTLNKDNNYVFSLLCAYTIQDDRLTTLFKGEVGHPYHHSFHQGDNYILMNTAHMGFQAWTKYSYNNGTILEREIYNKNNESYEDMEAYMEAEYKEPSEKAIEIYEVTNFEPVNNIDF